MDTDTVFNCDVALIPSPLRQGRDGLQLGHIDVNAMFPPKTIAILYLY